MPKEHSGIFFENRLAENEKYNVYDFHNLYNGGGIAVIDINNDGLQDLHFTGNQVYDKLYLNKGNLQFEDISARAGIENPGWSTGVAVVDINQDGLLDLYVCQSGNEPALQRANRLYVNNGDLTFSEEAAERGLADTTHSNHAAFFDFDKDGDMDMYLLTTSNDIRNPNLLHEKDRYGLYARDRLYVNDGTGHFSEEGLQRGIDQNNHGLGLAIADINLDGWDDILASSDFLPNDIVYMNNTDGTFSAKTSEILPYQSRFSMGNDIADLNNDGLPDIMTVDMLPTSNEAQKRMLMTSYHVFETEDQMGYDSEFTRNMLFLNDGIQNGLPRFSEIGMYLGVAATDWSWAPLMVDFDNDGMKDIAVSNGYLRDVTNSDFVSYNLSYSKEVKSADEMRAFMNRNAASLPHLKASNQFFRQNSELNFSNVTGQWTEASEGFSNGAVFADLDNDGDVDYVVNNINEPATLLRNNSVNNYLKVVLKGTPENPSGQGARVEIICGGEKQTWFQHLSRGYQSSVDPSIIFGCGKFERIEELRVFWPSGNETLLKNIKVNQTIGIKESEAEPAAFVNSRSILPLFTQKPTEIIHRENRYIDYYRENLLLQKYSMPGAAIAAGDINQDGIDEVYLGGNAQWPGQLLGFDEKGELTILKKWQGTVSEDADAIFTDFNADGFNDLYVVEGGNEYSTPAGVYQDKLFLNDKLGNLVETKELPDFDFPGSVICALDIDGDGDLDIFRGGSVLPGNFPKATPSVILKNNGGVFVEFQTVKLGIVTDAAALDWDKDGDTDIVLCGHYKNPVLLQNKSSHFTIRPVSDQLSGLWNAIQPVDLDGDGDEDLILGNIGENYRYSFSVSQPLSIYTGDKFKGFLPAYYLDNREVPVPTRDDLIRQFPGLRSQFPDYSSYAVSDFSILRKVFPKVSARVTEMKSIIIWNEEGDFKVQPMPAEAQRFSIRAIHSGDINRDGKPDLILAGNSYVTEPTNTGFIEGSKGLVLINESKGSFRAISNTQSGIWLDGQTTGLIPLKTKKGSELVAARNNASLILLNSSK